MNNDRFKFRGFDAENKVWRYGYYTKLVGGIRIYDAIVENTENELVSYYIHEQRSITQCTGLKDKNGVLIFEGDILNYPVSPVGGERGKYLFEASEVKWDYNRYKIYFSAASSEVIGNIYENPELLKEDSDD